MVLYVMKWDAHPDKWEDYLKWAQTAIKRTTSVPGVVEMRAYRPATGGSGRRTVHTVRPVTAWARWLRHAAHHGAGLPNFSEQTVVQLHY